MLSSPPSTARPSSSAAAAPALASWEPLCWRWCRGDFWPRMVSAVSRGWAAFVRSRILMCYPCCMLFISYLFYLLLVLFNYYKLWLATIFLFQVTWIQLCHITMILSCLSRHIIKKPVLVFKCVCKPKKLKGHSWLWLSNNSLLHPTLSRSPISVCTFLFNRWCMSLLTAITTSP